MSSAISATSSSRAGTTTPFSYGATITPEVANYDGNYPYGNAPMGVYRSQTMDVNNLYPNPWFCIITMAMYGNGWKIIDKIIMKEHQQMGVLS